MAAAHPELSLAEKRLLLALPRAGAGISASAVPGFGGEGEALLAAGGLQRHGLAAQQESSIILHAVTAEGARTQKELLPEHRAFTALHNRTLPLAALAIEARLSAEESRIIVGLVKKSGVAEAVKGPAGLELRGVATMPPALVQLSKAFSNVPANPTDLGAAGASQEIRALTERGLVQAVPRISRTLSLTPAGAALAATLKPDDGQGAEVSQITPELLASWATMSPAQKAGQHLRPFDFGVDVSVPSPGKAHPLDQMIEEIRSIFVSLGFREIAGDYVEPAFWNMDALFIPQDHPARDMQDTFYLKEPATAAIPDALFETVKGVQTTGGGTGSTGWGGQFQRKESERALLRTHTTVTTIRSLAADPRAPQRVFGIGRVFRNEAMDATHLPEFHQVEGIVLEDGADFGMLMGLLREFYTRLGFPEVKFRPSYYPYTEPSLDVAVKWQGRWLELGGAGIFRPEVTKPLGVKCNVLAWGLGLERLAMLRLGLKDIRDLYVSDIQWLRENPVR